MEIYREEYLTLVGEQGQQIVITANLHFWIEGDQVEYEIETFWFRDQLRNWRSFDLLSQALKAVCDQRYSRAVLDAMHADDPAFASQTTEPVVSLTEYRQMRL